MQEYPKWQRTGVNESTGEPVGRLIHSPEEEVIQPKVSPKTEPVNFRRTPKPEPKGE